MAKTRKAYKSADTGKFVTKDFAEKNPKTTFKQTIKVTPVKKKKKK